MIAIAALITSLAVLITSASTLAALFRKASNAEATAVKAEHVAQEIHILVNSRLSEETARADAAEAALVDAGLPIPETPEGVRRH